jgi:hypothetical protein
LGAGTILREADFVCKLEEKFGMPRYYFSTTHGDQHIQTDEEIELADDRAAWTEATIACGEILKDIDGKLKPNHEWRMDVNDEHHHLIFSLRLIPEAYTELPRKE